VTAGESFLSQHNPVQHFGLGTRTVAERVQITWPDGVVTVAHQVPAGYRRLAPYSGDCCYPEQTCETAWPDCPVWLPEVDDCGQNPGCELCEEVCARLESCGELSFDCQAECEDDPPSPAESACVLSAECSTVMDCLVE
jgi:hypothetical protein